MFCKKPFYNVSDVTKVLYIGLHSNPLRPHTCRHVIIQKKQPVLTKTVSKPDAMSKLIFIPAVGTLEMSGHTLRCQLACLALGIASGLEPTLVT
jgi:hypothetical protein